jgi:hypothetical protein
MIDVKIEDLFATTNYFLATRLALQINFLYQRRQ